MTPAERGVCVCARGNELAKRARACTTMAPTRVRCCTRNILRFSLLSNEVRPLISDSAQPSINMLPVTRYTEHGRRHNLKYIVYTETHGTHGTQAHTYTEGEKVK